MKPTVRCSGLDRRLNCPGSPTLEAKARAETLDLGGVAQGNSMQWRGNWCHWISAERLINEYGAYGKLTKPELPPGWKPSPWDERTAEWYTANLLADTPDNHIFYVEEHLTAEFERFVLSGHLDCYSINAEETEATINDLKTGTDPVDPADENWQLLGYAVLLKRRYPKLVRVRAKIFQRAADEPITDVLIEFDAVNAEAFLEKKINETLDQPLTFITGRKQCGTEFKPCPAIDFCPCVKAEINHMKMTLTPEELEKLKVVPDLKELAAVAAEARAIRGPIETILDTLKERIQLEGPTVLPDGTPVRVVESPGRRTIIHTNAAFVALASKVGEDKAWNTLSLSLTAAEDELVETGMKRTSKKGESAKGWIEERMNHLITRPTIKKLVFN
jgi:hypothetical protein